jgi:hypothetical protein
VFPIGDAVAAADCLERLRDSGLRSRLLRRGLALVAHRYSTMASIEQWSASLSEIAAKPPLPVACRLADATQIPAGRLDRLFGRRVSETIRELLRLKYDHSEPGGEWPHASLYSEVDEDAFWQLAISLDRRDLKISSLGAIPPPCRSATDRDQGMGDAIG